MEKIRHFPHFSAFQAAKELNLEAVLARQMKTNFKNKLKTGLI